MSRLYLSKEIFMKRMIEKAINDYSSLTCISVVEETKYWVLYFQKCRYGPELTMKEFENYLIGIEATVRVSHEDL